MSIMEERIPARKEIPNLGQIRRGGENFKIHEGEPPVDLRGDSGEKKPGSWKHPCDWDSKPGRGDTRTTPNQGEALR